MIYNDGDWKNDMVEGQGIYYWKNGNRYEDDFKNGLSDGKGIMYYNDGTIKKGIWKNNVYIGE